MALRDFNPIEKISAKAVVKYAFLPGIFPWLKNLSFAFSKIVFIFVQMLGAAGLIDPNHPCLRAENIGRYSFAEILLLAWRNIKLDREHIPQILMFFSVIAAIMMSIGVVLSAGGYLFTSYATVAHAQYFSMPDGSTVPYSASDDWVFKYLGKIFGGAQQTGIDFWGQGNVTAANPWYTAIFIGMLATYSKALLTIALFMILYLLLMALADAARTGKPFGSKFDGIWAPIRFAIAIGLLVPISGSGYNGGQMIAFQAATWGSNLATNLWQRGVSVNSDSARKNFIGASISDPGYRFVRDMFLVNLCVQGFNQLINDKHKPLQDYKKYITYVTASDNGKTMSYSFGNDDSSDYCGTVTVPKGPPVVPVDYASAGDPNAVPPKQPRDASGFFPIFLASQLDTAASLFFPGGEMKDTAQRLTKNLWCDRDKKLTDMNCPETGTTNCSLNIQQWVYDYWKNGLGRVADSTAGPNQQGNSPNNDFFLALYGKNLDDYNAWLYDTLQQDSKYGWASAGSFYLRMSYALSLVDDVVNEQPRVSKLPSNFYKIFSSPEHDDVSNEKVEEECGDKGAGCDKYAGPYALSEMLHKGSDWFAMSPKLVNDKVTPPVNNLAFYQKVGGDQWDSALQMTDKEAIGSSSSLKVMNPITSYLFDLVVIDSTSLNPLGQVISWGNSLITAASIAFGISIASGVVGLLPAFMGGGVASAISTFAYTVGEVLIIPGFLLMFIVPLLPFMYFMFAVIEWVVTIVEAIIGMPLWALSFITAKGDLAGSAIEGAKMLFEIVLRPTIIVFSLLSSIIIFTASVGYFNDAIRSYMDAFQETGPILVVGGIGMVVIYMIAIYSLALSCFKLITTMPNLFGRWLGLSGGFGAAIQFGAKGGDIALTSAVIVNQGTSIIGGTIGDIGGRARAEIMARDRLHEHDLWRTTGKSVYKRKWYGAFRRDADGRRILDEDKSYTGETERVAQANREASEFNATLGVRNAALIAAGLAPEAARQYQKLPDPHSLSYMRDTVRGKVGPAYIPGGFYDGPAIAPGTPPVTNPINNPAGLSGTVPPPGPVRPQTPSAVPGAPPVSRTGAPPVFTPSTSTSGTITGPNFTRSSTGSFGNVSGTVQAQGGAPRAGFGLNPNGVEYSLQQVKSALDTLGISSGGITSPEHVPGKDEIRRAFRSHERKGFTEVSESDAEAAFQLLKRALEF
jgi:conjugal transfer/type IV secretion protein DotA/TraY